MFRIVNAEGRVLLTTDSVHAAVRLADTTRMFAGTVQVCLFGEWVDLP